MPETPALFLGSYMRFRHDSDEEMCAAPVPGRVVTACMRTKGHTGDHISLACDAFEADGVCSTCRQPGTHGHDCPNCDDCYEPPGKPHRKACQFFGA